MAPPGALLGDSEKPQDLKMILLSSYLIANVFVSTEG